MSTDSLLIAIYLFYRNEPQLFLLLACWYSCVGWLALFGFVSKDMHKYA